LESLDLGYLSDPPRRAVLSQRRYEGIREEAKANPREVELVGLRPVAARLAARRLFKLRIWVARVARWRGLVLSQRSREEIEKLQIADSGSY